MRFHHHLMASHAFGLSSGGRYPVAQPSKSGLIALNSNLAYGPFLPWGIFLRTSSCSASGSLLPGGISLHINSC